MTNAPLHWGRCTREVLRAAVPESLVVLPIGAVEQHGPYLPTHTDIHISTHVATAAATRAMELGSIPIILAPALPFGISGHHRAFGGTLSLSTRTTIAVLEDLADSIEQQGGRRLLIVNGHGGNRGAARAVASAADARSDITIATVDYWEMGPESPGHAGRIETSLMLALDGENVVGPRLSRTEVPQLPSLGQVSYHGSWVWRMLDGYTDDPATADAGAGAQFCDAVVAGLADLMIAFGRLPA